jgi:hypothetical protein
MKDEQTRILSETVLTCAEKLYLHSRRETEENNEHLNKPDEIRTALPEYKSYTLPLALMCLVHGPSR